MPKMELGERITRLIEGLERAIEAWRKEGSVVFAIYANVVEEYVPKLRDLHAYSDREKKDNIRFIVKMIQDKESQVGQGRQMDDMEVTDRAEYVQLKRLAAQVENLLHALPAGR